MSQPQMAAHLFKDWEETMIWSCLQGVMGKIYADDSVCPRCAMALLGDFGFLAGRPDEELLRFFGNNKTRARSVFLFRKMKTGKSKYGRYFQMPRPA